MVRRTGMDAFAHACENALVNQDGATAHVWGALKDMAHAVGALEDAADAAVAECKAQRENTVGVRVAAHAAVHAAEEKLERAIKNRDKEAHAAHAAVHAAEEKLERAIKNSDKEGAALQEGRTTMQKLTVAVHAAAHAAAQTAAIEQAKQERAIKNRDKERAALQEGRTTMHGRQEKLGDVSGPNCTGGAEGSNKESVSIRRPHLPRAVAVKVPNLYVFESLEDEDEDEDESEHEDEDKAITNSSEEHESEQEDEDESNGSQKCAVPECEVLRLKGSEFCRETHRCQRGWLKKKGKASRSGHCKAQRERGSEYCGDHKCGTCHLSKDGSYDFCKNHKDG